jgi:Spy/CpxP family protein refolding chaperone
LCVTLSVLLIPLLSVAQSSEPKNLNACADSSSEKKGNFRDALAELKLTETQKQELMKLRKERKAEQKQNVEALQQLRKQIKEELLKKDPDRKKLDSYSEQIALTHKKIAGSMISHLLKVKTVISQEQFEKLLSLHWKEFMMHNGKKAKEKHAINEESE